MKIVFTGGGTGGHFYPIIAIAEAVNKIMDEEKLVDIELYYFSNEEYDRALLFENQIKFSKVEAGKIRRYLSVWNATDAIKTLFGIIRALFKLYLLYPDVVFGKGGYASFPVVFAAHLLQIPVVIHESDSLPGRVNLWAGKFAKLVGIAYPEAATYFPKEKTALVGMPIRRELLKANSVGAYEYLKLEQNLPVLFVLGGSQGSRAINEVLIDILPQLVEKYQIIHQVGRIHYTESKLRSGLVLEKHEHSTRYKLFDYLNEAALRMVAGVATLAVSRAGSTTMFELAEWGVPAIVIPIPELVSHDQRSNAFTYARAGAAIVIEEKNLTPHLLLSEIERLMGDEATRISMREKAKQFARPEAAEAIARELLAIGLEHEQT